MRFAAFLISPPAAPAAAEPFFRYSDHPYLVTVCSGSKFLLEHLYFLKKFYFRMSVSFL